MSHLTLLSIKYFGNKQIMFLLPVSRQLCIPTKTQAIFGKCFILQTQKSKIFLATHTVLSFLVMKKQRLVKMLYPFVFPDKYKLCEEVHDYVTQ